MLDELIRSNAVDKRWAEELIAGAATLEDLERAANRHRGQPLAHPAVQRPRLRGRGAAHGAALTDHSSDTFSSLKFHQASTSRSFERWAWPGPEPSLGASHVPSSAVTLTHSPSSKTAHTRPHIMASMKCACPHVWVRTNFAHDLGPTTTTYRCRSCGFLFARITDGLWDDDDEEFFCSPFLDGNLIPCEWQQCVIADRSRFRRVFDRYTAANWRHNAHQIW